MSEEEPIMEEEDETFHPEEDKVAIAAEELKPKPPTKFAPRVLLSRAYSMLPGKLFSTG